MHKQPNWTYFWYIWKVFCCSDFHLQVFCSCRYYFGSDFFRQWFLLAGILFWQWFFRRYFFRRNLFGSDFFCRDFCRRDFCGRYFACQSSNVQVHTLRYDSWMIYNLHFFLGDLMIFKHCEWALLSLSLQTHEWHEEFKFWPHFFQLCRFVNCNGKSQRSSNEDELFHRKYDKASNNFSRGRWRNTVGVVCSRKIKKKSSQ